MKCWTCSPRSGQKQAVPIRARRIAPTTTLQVCLQRLSEIAPDGMEFRPVSITGYDFAAQVKADTNGKPEQGRRKPATKIKGERTTSPKVDDNFVKQVVKATESKKPTTRKPTTTKPKTPVRKAPARATTRTKAAAK